MKSETDTSIALYDQDNHTDEVPMYTPEVVKQKGAGGNSHSIKNKELMLNKLLRKGFNFGIYRLRRSHYVRDEK